MDNEFGNFWEDLEKEKFLGVGEERIRRVVARILLLEYHLKLKSVTEDEKKDLVATSADRLDKDVKTLVRVSIDTSGVEKDELEDFYSDVVEAGAQNGIFITNAYFTKDARKFGEAVPMRLLDRKELTDMLYQIEAVQVEKAFISEADDQHVSKHFRRKLKYKLTNYLLGLPDKLDEIDRRYKPIAFYTIKKTKGRIEDRGYAYVDLSTGDLYYLDEGELRKNGTLGKILDLPLEQKNFLIELIEHGDVPYEHVNVKNLDILKRKRLISVHEERKSGGIPARISSEISSVVKIGVDQLGQFGNMRETSTEKQPSQAKAASPEKFIGAHVKIPLFDQPYNLEHFIEASKISEEFDPDAIKYKQEEVEDLLKKITGAEARFNYIVYLPYYRAKYSGSQGVKYETLLSLKFKSFFPKAGTYSSLYHVIDKFPDFPYLVMAFFYIGAHSDEYMKLFHTFASSFLYIIIAVSIGIILKGVFRTERTTPFYATEDYGIKVFRYGFPSLHSLVAAGAITFSYFIDTDGLLISLASIPIAYFYIYSRMKIGAHNRTDVLGGTLIGLFIGLLAGFFILGGTFIPPMIEIILTVLMTIGLVFSIIGRLKYIY